MADYSTASTNATTSLNESTDGGFVEEYEVAPGRRRVKRGKPMEQVQAALLLEGIAARRSAGSMFRVAKMKDAK